VVRIELEKSYGPEYAELIEILGKVREKLLTEKANNPYNKRILNELVEQDLPALLKKRSSAEIDHLLLKLCGPGFSLAELGIGKKDTE
jgi:precorrin-2 dehydrogenase/sirohydrochlorin ferrochelatase